MYQKTFWALYKTRRVLTLFFIWVTPLCNLCFGSDEIIVFFDGPKPLRLTLVDPKEQTRDEIAIVDHSQPKQGHKERWIFRYDRASKQRSLKTLSSATGGSILTREIQYALELSNGTIVYGPRAYYGSAMDHIFAGSLADLEWGLEEWIPKSICSSCCACS